MRCPSFCADPARQVSSNTAMKRDRNVPLAKRIDFIGLFILLLLFVDSFAHRYGETRFSEDAHSLGWGELIGRRRNSDPCFRSHRPRDLSRAPSLSLSAGGSLRGPGQRTLSGKNRIRAFPHEYQRPQEDSLRGRRQTLLPPPSCVFLHR